MCSCRVLFPERLSSLWCANIHIRTDPAYPDCSHIPSASVERHLYLFSHSARFSVKVALLLASMERKQPGRSRDDMTHPPGEATTTHQPPSTPTSSLLVVDDNSMNRIMLSRYISKLGYQAALAENGRQALDKLQTEPFDLVLLDVEMPEMDGYQVLEQLKVSPRLR